MKTTDVTGNPFEWLEYSANLSDNSRSHIVGEVLQLFPVNAQTTPKVSKKAWLTSGAGRSRLSLTMKCCWNGTELSIKLEWNRLNMKFWHWNGMEIDQEIL